MTSWLGKQIEFYLNKKWKLKEKRERERRWRVFGWMTWLWNFKKDEQKNKNVTLDRRGCGREKMKKFKKIKKKKELRKFERIEWKTYWNKWKRKRERDLETNDSNPFEFGASSSVLHRFQRKENEILNKTRLTFCCGWWWLEWRWKCRCRCLF